MHRVLNPKIHGFIDYAAIALLALAPTLFTFGGVPAALCYAIAVAYLAMCLLTAYPLGIAKVIPFPVHGGVELAAGIALIVAPFLFGFSEVADARNFFLIIGVAVVGVWMLTNYRAAETPGTRGALTGRRTHA